MSGDLPDYGCVTHKDLDEACLAALEEALTAWGVFADAAPDDDLREAAGEWGEQLEKHMVGIDFDEDAYRTVREYADRPEAAGLTGEDARRLSDLRRDYRRGGIGLPAARSERVKSLRGELAELVSAFEATLAG